MGRNNALSLKGKTVGLRTENATLMMQSHNRECILHLLEFIGTNEPSPKSKPVINFNRNVHRANHSSRTNFPAKFVPATGPVGVSKLEA